MPTHFARFRILNEKRIRNESDTFLHLRAHEEDEPFVLPPGAEAAYPVSPAGETFVDVQIDTEE